MYYSDDPVRDFERYDAYLARREAMLPVCEKCGESIRDYKYFEIDNEILCSDCVDDLYGRSTEDFLRDQE